MRCTKTKLVAKWMWVLVVIACSQPTMYLYAQEGQPFTGKDQWKNKYVKRAQEIRALRGDASTRQQQADSEMKEGTRQLFVEDIAPSRTGSPEEDLLKKYVKSYVTVLDPKSVSDIFGRRVAKRYVAFQVTVSNESKDYQFLIQDLSIDLGDVGDLESVRVPDNYSPSSNDLTLLRGVSEKGQVYDWRNLAVRLLRGTGSLAASLIGVTTFGSSYAPSVAVYNGPFATSFRDVLPDMTITQMNRMNDTAYQANTLVSKQGSKVVVAFVDQALLMDLELRKRFVKDPMAIADIVDFRKAAAKVHGMLITDALDQPPLISAIVIDEEQRKHFLDQPATIEGTIVGKNLTGAKIQLENAPTGVEVQVKGIPDSNRLSFTLTSRTAILPSSVSVLNFVVVRNNDVAKLSFAVPNRIEVPMLDSIAPIKLKQGEANKEITLSGNSFIKSLFSVAGCDRIKVKDPVWQSATEIKIKVDVPADAETGPCNIQVKNGVNFVSGPQVLTIEKAN
jgi:hypothetical protein